MNCIKNNNKYILEVLLSRWCINGISENKCEKTSSLECNKTIVWCRKWINNGFDWGKPEVEYRYIIKNKILMNFYWVDVDKGTASNPDTTKHIICLLCIMFVLTTDYTFLKCN